LGGEKSLKLVSCRVRNGDLGGKLKRTRSKEELSDGAPGGASWAKGLNPFQENPLWGDFLRTTNNLNTRRGKGLAPQHAKWLLKGFHDRRGQLKGGGGGGTNLWARAALGPTLLQKGPPSTRPHTKEIWKNAPTTMML